MKHSLKLISTTLLTAALLTSTALALPNPESAKPAHENWTAPSPSEVVAPAFASRFEGDILRVRISIDELGKPSEVTVLNRTDRDLKKSIVEAVEQWRFTPATRDGKAVKSRVVLPIELKLDYSS